jgi:hypothetical protein
MFSVVFKSFAIVSENLAFTFIALPYLHFHWFMDSLTKAGNDGSIRRPPAIVMWLGHRTCRCGMFACVGQCRTAALMR